MKILSSFKYANAVLLLLSLLVASPSYSQLNVDTDVGSNVDVDGDYGKLRPSKFLKCWGKAPEYKNFLQKFELTEEQQNSNVGSILNSYTAGSHMDMPSFDPKIMNWESRPEGWKWTIDFTSKTDTTQYKNDVDLTCTKFRRSAQVNKLTMKTRFRSSASFTVPGNVYFIKIIVNEYDDDEENLLEPALFIMSPTQLRAKATGDNVTYDAIKGSFLRLNDFDYGSNDIYGVANPVYYLPVKPGDVVEMGWRLKPGFEGVSNIQFDLNMELNLFGADNCKSVVGNPKEVGNNLTGIVKELKSLTKEGTTLDNGKQKKLFVYKDMDKAMEYFSCLRDPKYIREMLVNNHSSEIFKFVTDVKELFFNEIGLSQDNIDTPFAKVRLLVASFIYDMSWNIAKDMKMYCDATDVSTLIDVAKDLDGDAMKRPKFVVLSHEWVKFRFLSDVAKFKELQPFLDWALKAAGDDGHLDISEISNPNVFFSYYGSMSGQNDPRVFEKLIATLKVVPETLSGKVKREQAVGLLYEAQEILNSLMTPVDILPYHLDMETEQFEFSVVEMGQKYSLMQTKIDEILALVASDISYFSFADYEGDADELRDLLLRTRTKFSNDLNYVIDDLLRGTLVTILPALKDAVFVNKSAAGVDVSLLGSRQAKLFYELFVLDAGDTQQRMDLEGLISMDKYVSQCLENVEGAQ